MTMFAHHITASTGPNSVKTLLKNISDGPSGEDTTANRIAAVVIETCPQLLAVPNPMKTWATMLRTELGKIAQAAWSSTEHIESLEGMDARVLEVLSMFLYAHYQVAMLMLCPRSGE